MLSYARALLAVAAFHLVQAASSKPGQETFLSRPGQVSIKLDVQMNRHPKSLAPGYIFTSPYDRNPTGGYGTHIYTMDGELVFCGAFLQEKRATDSHLCNFNGETTLCFTDSLPTGDLGPGHSPGQDRFFDNTYTQVGHDYGKAGNLTLPDSHELNTPASLHGKGMVLDVFQPVRYDLTQYDGPKDGWVISGCFQQRDFKTDTVQFQWCSDVHVPFYESYKYIEGNSAGNSSNGDKGTRHSPWDYFHINSIDRDDNGDYYVSSRATHTIYKVAGLKDENPGRIIWRLGGRYNDFKLKGRRKLYFYSQHDIRVIKMRKNLTRISLFDNHSPENHSLPPANSTTGKYIELNTDKMTAKLVELYYEPAGGYASTGGQVQTLSNGNVFIGWGALPAVSEHEPGNPGKALYYATFDNAYKSYKSYKYEWVGNPAQPPDLFAYQHKCTSQTMAVYMSWNGATEYQGFQVFGNDKKSNKGGTRLGSHQLAGDIFQKTGYETVANIPVEKTFYKYVYINAMGSDGKVLGQSQPLKTFVPNHDLSKNCGHLKCPEGTDYGKENSIADEC